MFNSPYNTYNHQVNIDRINNQIADLERIKQQLSQPSIQQPTNLTQNFQFTPTNQVLMKFANSIEDVKKEIVIGDTPYFSNDLSVVWIKNNKGNIKAYELKEIVEKDEKDILIESLQYQINELKEVINNAKPINSTTNESIESEEPTNVSSSNSSKTKPKRSNGIIQANNIEL